MDELEHLLRLQRARVAARVLEPNLNESDLSKGNAAQEGEVREWKGRKFKKQGKEWVPVTGERKKAPERNRKEKKSKQESQKPKTDIPSKDMGDLRRIKKLVKEKDFEAASDLAEGLSDEAKNAIPGSVWEQMSQTTNPITKQEKSSSREKTIVKDSKERLKNFVSKNKEMFDTGEHAHPERSRAAKFLRAKAKGFVKALKNEITHIKESGSLIKKLFTGKGGEITKHEKKAIKKLGISLGLTAATMLATGGIGAFTHGFTNTATHLGIHFVEHGLIESAGMAAIFAKAEAGEISEEQAMEALVDEFINWIENGDWSELAENIEK